MKMSYVRKKRRDGSADPSKVEESNDTESAQEPLHCNAPGFLLLHLICVAFYLIPILMPSQYNLGKPVLDELHIVSPENEDINGESTLRTIFSNDYWGRSLQFESSHKSWRPLTVLSFRYLKGGAMLTDITAHRLVNVLTHACIAELVSILATKLVLMRNALVVMIFDTPVYAPHLVRILTKLVFSLHLSHVEVTANAANRGHLLGVLCGVLCSDPDVPVFVFLLALLCGFLCSETFLFQVVSAAVTLMAIVYLRRDYTARQSTTGGGSLVAGQITTMSSVLPRCLLLLLGGVVYYGARHYYDTLSIPTGLIRPAENPFFELTGWVRVYSYAYVLAIHVAKAWGGVVDFVGSSHEYGRDCIRPILSRADARLWVPVALVGIYAVIGVSLVLRANSKQRVTPFLVWFLVHVSWMGTLFPVCGIVKVGTFVSDRIVVAASVSTSMVVAAAIVYWLRFQPLGRQHRKIRLFRITSDAIKVVFVALFLLLSYRRIYLRSLDWMDSLPLLQSSLVACPRFAKAHLEVSKIYSGLYPEHYNLTRSRYHLQRAEEIDPDYCDVHQQFAHVAIQEHGFEEFEDRLSKALLCPFTMGGSLGLWQNYWKIALDPAQQSPKSVQAARKRYQSYMAVINQAIEKDEESGGNRHGRSSSPLTLWGGSNEEL